MSQIKVNSIVPSGGLPAGAAGGGIIQVVQTVKTDATTVNTSTWTTIMSATITPQSSSNKIMLFCDLKYTGSDNQTTSQMRFLRGATRIYAGDASGSRERAVSQNYWQANNYNSPTSGGQYVDSPATTSATTYYVQVKSENTNTSWINRTGNDRDSQQDARTASSFTLMELSV